MSKKSRIEEATVQGGENDTYEQLLKEEKEKRKEMRKQQRKKSGFRFFDLLIPLLITFASICALAYPFVSNWLYENQERSTIEVYDAAVEDTSDEEMAAILEEAHAYNEALIASKITLTDPFSNETISTDGTLYNYYEILSFSNTGVMCYLDIPKINLYLGVYHGATSDTLSVGVGHLAGSSVPVGGTSTHAVLSAHTGYNNAKLFTDLENMEEGDYFFIHVCGETLAYQVDQIEVVEPNETEDLAIVPGEDYVTLVTCTPYGINTHRLLVRGTRVEYTQEVVEEAEEQGANATYNSLWMVEYVRAIGIGLGIVNFIAYAMFFIMLIRRRRKALRRF